MSEVIDLILLHSPNKGLSAVKKQSSENTSSQSASPHRDVRQQPTSRNAGTSARVQSASPEHTSSGPRPTPASTDHRQIANRDGTLAIDDTVIYTSRWGWLLRGANLELSVFVGWMWSPVGSFFFGPVRRTAPPHFIYTPSLDKRRSRPVSTWREFFSCHKKI